MKDLNQFIKTAIREILNENIKNSFNEFIKDVLNYKTPINISDLPNKKGHPIDNLPKNIDFIYVDSSLFEKEQTTWGEVSKNKIAYHDRPTNDNYWNKMIDNGKEPLIIIEFDEDRNQLRVVDGNHRLTVYLNKGFTKIPAVLTNDAINYIRNFTFLEK